MLNSVSRAPAKKKHLCVTWAQACSLVSWRFSTTAVEPPQSPQRQLSSSGPLSDASSSRLSNRRDRPRTRSASTWCPKSKISKLSPKPSCARSPTVWKRNPSSLMLSFSSKVESYFFSKNRTCYKERSVTSFTSFEAVKSTSPRTMPMVPRITL